MLFERDDYEIDGSSSKDSLLLTWDDQIDKTQ